MQNRMNGSVLREILTNLPADDARAASRVPPPKSDPRMQLFSSLALMVPMLIQAIKAMQPVDLDGPKAKQVRREFAAEEARLQAMFAAERARIVAEFGPRLDAARLADGVPAK